MDSTGFIRPQLRARVGRLALSKADHASTANKADNVIPFPNGGAIRLPAAKAA